MMILGKKGLGVGDIAPVCIGLVIASISVGIGAQMLGTISDSMSGNSSAQLVVNNGTQGLVVVSGYFPIIGLIVAASIIIGVVYKSFMSG